MCSDQLAFEIANVRQFPLVTANAHNTAKENKCIHTTTLNRIMAPHTHTHAIVAFIPRKLTTLQMKGYDIYKGKKKRFKLIL